MLTDILYFFMIVFGIYGFSILIAYTSGPFSIFSQTRENVSKYLDGTWIEEGFHCPFCIGFWLAVLSAPYISTGIVNYLFLAFGLTGINAFLLMLTGVPANTLDTDEEDDTLHEG